jgi:DNA helicase IV
VSYTNWNSVAEHLQLNDGAGAEPQVMSRGYRSTNAILRFADELLPPALRQAGSIQDDGPEVQRIRETKSKRLYSRAIRAAADLARKYPDGTVAVISVYPDALARQLGIEGWRRPNPDDIRTWAQGDVNVRIYSPERARGLEFDAVVVIEPRQFDNDAGRHGQLYTSLTRANRELAIVHHQTLPAALRTAK